MCGGAAALSVALVGCGLFDGWGKREGEVDFETEVKPIFEHRCLHCHSRKDPKGGLSLQDRDVVMKTYRGGTKLIDPGFPKRSLIFASVAQPGAHPDMMPRDGWKLSDAQLVALGKWIAQGAEWPGGTGGELEVKEMIVEMDDYP